MPPTPQGFESITRIVIIGPGHWGRALGTVFAPLFEAITFLGDGATPDEWATTFRGSPPLVILATPFSAILNVLKALAKYEVAGVVNASKGIDRKTLLTFSSLAKQYIRSPFGTLSGPTFAKEVLDRKPTACVFGSRNAKFAQWFSRKITQPRFRVYSSTDPLGVETCGAIKNILAIACGVSDGLNLGHNARAALLARGLREMTSIVRCMGGKSETVFGLAGVGDLWLTATGDLSRNRQLGIFLSKESKVEEALQRLDGPSEGFYTVQQVHRLALKKKMDLPICEQVYKICKGDVRPRDAIENLMRRESKPE